MKYPDLFIDNFGGFTDNHFLFYILFIHPGEIE